MDSPSFRNSRRKTLDISRLTSTTLASPSKDKRYSWDPSQSPLRLSSTAEKLEFIEKSLKVLKTETNPLCQTEKLGLRSLTAPSSNKHDGGISKSTKWIHKNDTAESGASTSVENLMPPRYQRRHTGLLGSSHSPQNERKNRQPGCGTLFFTVLAVVGLLVVNYWFIDNFQKSLCSRNLMLNTTSFNATLQDQVYGQHLAVDIVPSLVHEHMVPVETKPLVMAFLGWTGVGKNYVSSILGDLIRTKRRTVHKYIVPLHFPNTDSTNTYPHQVQNWIMGNLSSCAINLVIIDEMEKASEDVLLGIELVLEKFDRIRLNSTRVIVLLLSSSGGIQINNFVYERIRSGGERDSITNQDVLKVLEDTEAQWYLSLHSRGLIDSVVPFLPLQKRHVARCIEQDIERKHDTCASPHIIAKVMKELTFFPSEDPLFSKAGCRKVGTKVDLIIDSVESGHSYYTKPLDNEM